MTTPNGNRQINVWVEPEVYAQIDRIAQAQFSSRPAIVRQAIALYLSQNINTADSNLTHCVRSQPE